MAVLPLAKYSWVTSVPSRSKCNSPIQSSLCLSVLIISSKHFSPSSSLFKPHQRNGIIASNVGLALMTIILAVYTRNVGFSNFVKFYFIPYLVRSQALLYGSVHGLLGTVCQPLDRYVDFPPPHGSHTTSLPQQGVDLAPRSICDCRPTTPRTCWQIFPSQCT